MLNYFVNNPTRFLTRPLANQPGDLVNNGVVGIVKCAHVGDDLGVRFEEPLILGDAILAFLEKLSGESGRHLQPFESGQLLDTIRFNGSCPCGSF